jgi:hypothetical protein
MFSSSDSIPQHYQPKEAALAIVRAFTVLGKDEVMLGLDGETLARTMLEYLLGEGSAYHVAAGAPSNGVPSPRVDPLAIQ